MMDNRLNFFSPYENASASHENQLTRAFLVVLRYSPLCHQEWLRLIRSDRNLYDLPKPEFATQRQRIVKRDVNITQSEGIPGISVWLAPDASESTKPVEPSERHQILDGIVMYGTELVVVIENKIVRGSTTDQSNKINLHGSPVIFDAQPRPVKWETLLAILADLMDGGLISGAERTLVTDFLEFVEQHFETIGPYSTLKRCGDSAFRLERRLDMIQGQALKTESGTGSGWRDIEGTSKISMARLGLAADRSAVLLQMYPGDTLAQSRAFYGDSTAVDNVLALRSEGWNMEPNFHWGFMATGYAWLTTPLTVDAYCSYWKQHVGETREMPRPEWQTYWSALESQQIVLASEKSEFDAHFTNTKRQKAHARPGLRCEYRWSLEEATRLDQNNKFIDDVRYRVNQLLTALQPGLTIR